MSFNIKLLGSYRDFISVITIKALGDGRLFVYGKDLREGEATKYKFFLLKDREFTVLAFQLPEVKEVDQFLRNGGLARSGAVYERKNTVGVAYQSFIVEWDLSTLKVNYFLLEEPVYDEKAGWRGLNPLHAYFDEDKNELYVVYQAYTAPQCMFRFDFDGKKFITDSSFFYLTSADYESTEYKPSGVFKGTIGTIGRYPNGVGSISFHTAGEYTTRGMNAAMLACCNWQGNLEYIETDLPKGLTRLTSDGQYLLIRGLQNPVHLYIYRLEDSAMQAVKLTPKRILAGASKWLTHFDINQNVLWLVDHTGAFVRHEIHWT